MSRSKEFNVLGRTRVCELCEIPMRVFGIERHPTLVGMALRSHECPQCENLQTDIVPSAQEWLDPAEDNPVNPTFLLSVSEGFDDEIVDIFGSAFEAAWQSLQVSDSRLTHEAHIASTRELLAKWILVLGKRGERDRNQLVEKALALLAQSNPETRESSTAESSTGVPSPRQSSSLHGTNSRHLGSMSDRRKSS
jgi:hypothetical protein